MHSTGLRCFGLAMVLACAPVAVGDEQAWPPRFDFEDDAMLGAWCTQAREAEISITRALEYVRSGEAALELVWTATTGRLAILSAGPLQIKEGALSLRLSFKTGEQSPVMYGVREAGGASYQGYAFSPGGVWHDLAVNLSELMLSEDSQDDNDRLDADQITGIIFADLSNLSGEAGASLGIKSGRQRLWIDDVELSAEAAPLRSRTGEVGEIIIDDFDGGVIRCLPIGGPRMELVPAPEEYGGSALAVTYSAAGYRWAGFVAAVGYLDLSDRTHICLQVKADTAAPLTVVLEERNGAKYQMRQRLDPAKQWQTLRLPFERFKLDPQSTDDNDRLDLDQLRVIIPVLDAKRAELGEAAEGSWTVSRIWAE